MTSAFSRDGRGRLSPRRQSPSVSPDGRSEEKTVRNHLLSALVLGLAAHAAPALAQDRETINVNSEVNAFCANFAAAPAALDLGELSGANGFVVSTFAGETVREVATDYYCNAPSKVTLKAVPLTHTTITTVADASSFSNRVDYDASLTWGPDVSGSVSSTLADGDDILAAVATVGDLTVTISNPNVDGNRRPIAGAYAGAVELTVALNP